MKNQNEKIFEHIFDNVMNMGNKMNSATKFIASSYEI